MMQLMNLCAALALGLLFMSLPGAALAASAPLPKATQDDLKKLKLDPAILSDLDKELTVPQSWIEGAKKEKPLRIFSTFDPPQAEIKLRAFKERYPYIAIEYNRASHEDRSEERRVGKESRSRW